MLFELQATTELYNNDLFTAKFHFPTQPKYEDLRVAIRDRLTARSETVRKDGYPKLDFTSCRLCIVTGGGEMKDVDATTTIPSGTQLYVFHPGMALSAPSIDVPGSDDETSSCELISPKSGKPDAVFNSLMTPNSESGDGYLPQHLLLHALQLCGLNPTYQSIAELVAAVDTDKNGQIDRDEFLSFCDSLRNTKPSYHQMQETFATFDRDGNGFLDRDEFAELLRAEGEPLTDEEVAVALALADVNGDGRIDLEELVRMLCETTAPVALEPPPRIAPVPPPDDSPETVLKQDELNLRLEEARQRATMNQRRRAQESSDRREKELVDEESNRRAEAEFRRNMQDKDQKDKGGQCCIVC